MLEHTNKDVHVSPEQLQVAMPLPDDVMEQLAKDSAEAGGEWSEQPEYIGAIGRTMFDLPNSEDNTVTVLLPNDAVHAAPSQALVRIRSVTDNRRYLGIVVKGPFAEPDGLRGDAPIMITTAVGGGAFFPRSHGGTPGVVVGEEGGGRLRPPRPPPLANSPPVVLGSAE